MVRRRFCPNCGSEKVGPDFSDAAYIGAAGGNPNAWRCSNCGFTGMMPEKGGETSEEVETAAEEDSSGKSEEIEFEPGKDYRRFSTDFGIGELKFYIYIVMPAVLLYLIYLLIIN